MKHIILLFLFLISKPQFSQNPDTRAELEIKGRINEISVSPDESIWLVSATGKTYYTKNIHSNWHYGKPVFEDTSEYNYNAPHLERASFFNKDTAIISGYISYDTKGHKKNGYYLTHNGGRTWELLDYGGNSWIYTAFVNKRGKAWLGGLYKELYYSDDFGSSWKTIELPYKSSDRVYSICMVNDTEGIIGSDDNEIISTTDNWKTAKNIPTPFDQKQPKKNQNVYADERISKILIWNGYIVINQAGHISFTNKNSINWKDFPVKVIDFESDPDTKKLYAVTSDFKIIAFSAPDTFEVINDHSLKRYPLDMKALNNALYVIDNAYETYKITAKEVIHTIPYTVDHKIARPYIIKKANHITWGISGYQVYLSKDGGQEWYRENALDFGIHDFSLLNDSTAILWDGKKNNYVYSLRAHQATLYSPQNPIGNFLKDTISSFNINSGSQGCYHHVNYKVDYARINDSVFETSQLATSSYENKNKTFKNNINARQLDKILYSINLKPEHMPALKDFNITESDRKNYLKLVDARIKNKDEDHRISKDHKAFYYSVPATLDTLNNSILPAILNKNETTWSTTSNWFTANIINRNNDTLHISRNYYVSTLPWNLPWKIEYKGLNFNCYDIELSRFIKNCIPDNFMDIDVFDNKLLIMQIAEYLKKPD